MKDKLYELMKDGTMYQFLILIALLLFDGYSLVMTGKLDDTVTGCIIGLAIGLPINQNNKNRGV